MAKQFRDFRTIAAKFDSIGTCSHPIKRGDTIGFAPGGYRGRGAETQCAQCWQAWQASVASDNFDAEVMGVQ